MSKAIFAAAVAGLMVGTTVAQPAPVADPSQQQPVTMYAVATAPAFPVPADTTYQLKFGDACVALNTTTPGVVSFALVDCTTTADVPQFAWNETALAFQYAVDNTQYCVTVGKCGPKPESCWGCTKWYACMKVVYVRSPLCMCVYACLRTYVLYVYRESGVRWARCQDARQVHTCAHKHSHTRSRPHHRGARIINTHAYNEHPRTPTPTAPPPASSTRTAPASRSASATAPAVPPRTNASPSLPRATRRATTAASPMV